MIDYLLTAFQRMHSYMTISYSEVLDHIASKPKDFAEATDQLLDLLRPWTVQNLCSHLQQAGTIPEQYAHDSSEEKLYGKYCDILVLGFLEVNGFESELTRARGNRADVEARCGASYSIVADAKAARKSRTAHNPKDYKIGELNVWRMNAKADYACLIASQFPGDRSRVFREAVQNNVCLLSFLDLYYLLSKHGQVDCLRLRSLWSLPSSLSNIPEMNGSIYWKALKTTLDKI